MYAYNRVQLQTKIQNSQAVIRQIFKTILQIIMNLMQITKQGIMKNTSRQANSFQLRQSENCQDINVHQAINMNINACISKGKNGYCLNNNNRNSCNSAAADKSKRIIIDRLNKKNTVACKQISTTNLNIGVGNAQNSKKLKILSTYKNSLNTCNTQTDISLQNNQIQANFIEVSQFSNQDCHSNNLRLNPKKQMQQIQQSLLIESASEEDKKFQNLNLSAKSRENLYNNSMEFEHIFQRFNQNFVVKYTNVLNNNNNKKRKIQRNLISQLYNMVKIKQKGNKQNYCWFLNEHDNQMQKNKESKQHMQNMQETGHFNIKDIKQQKSAQMDQQKDHRHQLNRQQNTKNINNINILQQKRRSKTQHCLQYINNHPPADLQFQINSITNRYSNEQLIDNKYNQGFSHRNVGVPLRYHNQQGNNGLGLRLYCHGNRYLKQIPRSHTQRPYTYDNYQHNMISNQFQQSRNTGISRQTSQKDLTLPRMQPIIHNPINLKPAHLHPQKRTNTLIQNRSIKRFAHRDPILPNKQNENDRLANIRKQLHQIYNNQRPQGVKIGVMRQYGHIRSNYNSTSNLRTNTLTQGQDNPHRNININVNMDRNANSTSCGNLPKRQTTKTSDCMMKMAQKQQKTNRNRGNHAGNTYMNMNMKDRNNQYHHRLLLQRSTSQSQWN